jgi:hypothetical protein
MEPKEQIKALNIPPRFVGVIKEEPVKRWLAGQEIWDKRFHRQALHAAQKREKYERKYAASVEQARAQGLQLVHETDRPAAYRQRRMSRLSRVSTMSIDSAVSTGDIVPDKRYGTFGYMLDYMTL